MRLCRNPGTAFLTIFLTSFLLSVVLATALIPSQRGYWVSDFSFGGTVEGNNGQILPYQFDGQGVQSTLRFSFDPYILPFISTQMRMAADPYLAILGTHPLGDSGSFTADWSGNSSGIGNYPAPFGWNAGDGTGSLALENETLIIMPSSPSGFLSVYNYQNQTFSSNASDVVTMRVDMFVNVEWYLNVLTNNTWTRLRDINGLETGNQTGMVVFQLPPHLEYQNPAITAKLLSLQSPGRLEISRIQFGHITGGTSMTISVNDHVVLNRTLIPQSLLNGPSLAAVQTNIHLPISALVSGRTTATLAVSGGASWAVSGAVLHIFVNVPEENPQAWTLLPYPVAIFGGSSALLLALVIKLLRAFLYWLAQVSLRQ